MLLYDHPFSPFAQKVRIMLREKGLQFEFRPPEGLGGGDDAFRRHNPRLEVPALVIEGQSLFDSTIILEFLEDRFPEPALRAPDPLARARAREVEEVCDTHFEAITWGLGEVIFFGRGEYIADALRQAASDDLKAIYSWLDSRLCPSGWLNGDNFGLADLAAVPFVAASEMFGLGPEAGSPLAVWLASVRRRNAVATTLDEAAQAGAMMGDYRDFFNQPGVRRQYRDHRLEWILRAGGLSVIVDGINRDTIRFTDMQGFAN